MNIFFFDRDIRISTNITVQMAAAAEIFCKNFNQAEVMNSVAAAALEENRSDEANGCLQNRGTIKQISMEQCLVRVMRLGLVSWLGTPWGRLLQLWLKKSLNRIVWTAWRWQQRDVRSFLLQHSVSSSASSKAIQKLLSRHSKVVICCTHLLVTFGARLSLTLLGRVMQLYIPQSRKQRFLFLCQFGWNLTLILLLIFQFLNKKNFGLDPVSQKKKSYKWKAFLK